MLKELIKVSAKRQRLFENLLFCKECGNALTITYRKIKIIGLSIVINMQEIQEEDYVNHILCHMIN